MKICPENNGANRLPPSEMLTNDLLCVTVGATSLHSTGFKQGGLFDILSHYNHSPDTKTSRRSPIKFDQLARCLQYGEVNERIETLELLSSIQSKCSNLKMLSIHVADEIGKNFNSRIDVSSLDRLSKSIGSLLSIFDKKRIPGLYDKITVKP